MQALLNMHGGLPAPVPENGVFDAQTSKAVEAFQRARNLDGKGVYNAGTRLALVRVLPTGAAKSGWSAPWMDIAAAEAAAKITQKPGEAKEQRILDYHAATWGKASTDEVPWCSAFVNWVLNKAGYRVEGHPGAISWIRWGVQTMPGYGAITVVERNGQRHVGFFVDDPSERIRLLGGNQGGMVKEENFLLRSYKVLAYRWPAPSDEPAQP
jgi:uncharacterized protein (TIGR02594 family)